MSQTLKATDIMATGLMTFALFLGAGNIIFPPFLGHMAGSDLMIAMLGFLLTGVGLPLLGVLVIIAVGALFFPQGEAGAATESMISQGFFNGFREGYQTMDTLGALVFGVVIINAIQNKGVTDTRQVARYTFIAGLIASVGLSLVYLVLGYIGATSHQLVGPVQNGAEIISLFVDAVFGAWGKVVLAITVILACLTTAIGLLSACGEYFSRVFSAFNYRTWVILCALASALIANVGLNTLLLPFQRY